MIARKRFWGVYHIETDNMECDIVFMLIQASILHISSRSRQLVLFKKNSGFGVKVYRNLGKGFRVDRMWAWG